jgi:hypothetical protein
MASLGLQPVLEFLASIGKSGCLHLSREGWAGRLSLEGGQLLGASFGQERGLAALDAILLVLSDGEFSFSDQPCAATSDVEFLIPIADLPGRVPLLANGHGLAGRIPGPATVPHLSDLSVVGADGTEMKLRVSTLRTLLAVDGQRTIQEIGQYVGTAKVLSDLAILMNLGLVSFETQPNRSVQLVG